MRSFGRAVVEVLPAWLAARAIVVVALVFAHLTVATLRPDNPGAAARVHEGLLAWDAGWYQSIAAHGYVASGMQSVRFFPLLPLVAAGVGRIPGVGPGPGVVIVANLAALAGMATLFLLVRRETGDHALARRSAWLFALAPPAYALVLGYAEGAMLLCATSAFLALRSRRWWWAAFAGAAAGLVRPLGLLVAVPAAIEAWRARTEADDRGSTAANRRPRAERGAAASGPAAPAGSAGRSGASGLEAASDLEGASGLDAASHLEGASGRAEFAGTVEGAPRSSEAPAVETAGTSGAVGARTAGPVAEAGVEVSGEPAPPISDARDAGAGRTAPPTAAAARAGLVSRSGAGPGAGAGAGDERVRGTGGRARWRLGPRLIPRLAAVVAPFVGTGAFLLWVDHISGDPLLPFRVQEQAGRRGPITWPLPAALHDIRAVLHGHHFGTALHLPWIALAIFVLVFAFRKLPVSYGAFAAAVLAVSLSSSNLDSFERYALSAFPLVVTASMWTASRRVERIVLAVSALGMAGYAVLVFFGMVVP